MPKRKPTPKNALRDFERKQLVELKAALEAYQEVLDTRWLPMVQPLVTMAIRHGAVTTTEQMILLESVYKDQLSTAVGQRAHFARLRIRSALEAIANGYGWTLRDIDDSRECR